MSTYGIYEKTYNLNHLDVRIHLLYIADNIGSNTFELNCIKLGEIESGYEDDDQLTFYPNVLKMEFTDVNRNNYETLKLILENYPVVSQNETTTFELYIKPVNEVERRVFLGSIDKSSLKYYESDRKVCFDVIDISKELKNLTVGELQGTYASIPYYIHKAYLNIFPYLEYVVTTDINVFKQATFNGIYFKHNWRFESWLTHIVKNFIGAYEDITFYQSWYNKIFEKDNYAEVLKALAMQFGMSIGCEEPNKIYAYKRFVSNSYAESQAIDITGLLLDDYTKELWLPNVICVRNTFQTLLQGAKNVVAGTYIANEHDATKPKNLDTVLEITTDMSTNVSFYGSTMYMKVLTGTGYETIEYCYDPDLQYYGRLEDLIAQLYLSARTKSKDKFEFELYGINYSMADYYKIQQSGYATKILRPLVLKKDLINNKTKLTALEIGMNL